MCLICSSMFVMPLDYEYSLFGLPEGSPERSRPNMKSMSGVHVGFKNYVSEMEDYTSSLANILEYLVPQEYVQIMRESMLNRCPVSSYEQVCEVFKKELGRTPDEVFDEFEPIPIASASLAQVHTARTRDGQKVAVKSGFS
ncbi:putative ABC1 protein [Vitis vinifera]|uniref:Putative ABC1 protein n=1 Tax=Vitis vinifera TaxID=29760 RepID=A0A438HA99_VITVI|nr:putative ABC1 protein [Vitis vinifera]